MKDLLNKITFRLLIGQILPGAFLALTICIALNFTASGTQIAAAGMGPKEIIALYDAALRASNSAYGLVILATFSAILGLALQTSSNLATANMESFRNKVLGPDNSWTPKSEKQIRKRSRLRCRIADLWFKRNIWLIIMVSPLLLLFDFFSIITAKPRDIYKDIYLLRLPPKKLSAMESIIADHEYSSDYFSNMAMALGAHLILCCFLFDFSAIGIKGALYILVVYVLISLHYFSYRVVRNSIDKAIYLAFEQTNKDNGKED
jgi:hypothetical protein